MPLGPKADMPMLFNYLIGDLLEVHRNFKTERIGRLQIDDQFVLLRRLHGQFGWFCTLEDTVNVVGSALKLLENIIPIRDQAASIDEVTTIGYCRQLVPRCERDDQFEMDD